MKHIIKTTALPGSAISVIRTKGGSDEELTMNKLCSYLEKSSTKFLIFLLKPNNCYNPRIHGVSLLKFERLQLQHEYLYTIPYKRILNIIDAKNYSGSYIITDWSFWNRYFIGALRKTLPDYVFIFTVGEDEGASEDIVRTSLDFSSGVFLTMSNHNHYSVSQIKWYIDNLNNNELEKLYVSCWTMSANKESNKVCSAVEFLGNHHT